MEQRDEEMTTQEGRGREERRLQAVRRYDILDTPPEDQFDRIARMIMRVFDVPYTYITLVDEKRVWIKSGCNQENGMEVPRHDSICNTTIKQHGVFVVNDLTTHPKLSSISAVTGGPKYVFYAGASITTNDGYRLGSICICDTKPRQFSEEKLSILEDVAAMIMDLLETRRLVATLEASSIKETTPKMVTICAWTKLIRDHDKWIEPSLYLQRHFGIKVTHGLNETEEARLIEEIDLNE